MIRKDSSNGEETSGLFGHSLFGNFFTKMNNRSDGHLKRKLDMALISGDCFVLFPAS